MFKTYLHGGEIFRIGVLLVALSLVMLQNCGSSGGGGGNSTHVDVLPIIPSTGVYIGGILKVGQTTIDEFNSLTGIKHKVFMEFLQFPDVLNTSGAEYAKIADFIAACKAANAIPMLTLETFGTDTVPWYESYTADQINEFALMLYNFNVSMFLRWNHEMNGSWYPWGQQPTTYIAKFQEFADVIHSEAKNVAIAWTPNQGWGYPWAGGTYSISPSSPDYSVLDTNKDGVVNDLDDPYSPYYPGDDYVDWVGFSFYHWGNGSNRGVNEVPSTDKWGQANGIGNTIPNFHDIYAVGHDKPMMIAEISALYNVSGSMGGDASEANIKKEWITQVYNLTNDENVKIDESLPSIHMILWFSQLKYEAEVSSEVDWRLTDNQEVVDFYRTIVADDYFIKSD